MRLNKSNILKSVAILAILSACSEKGINEKQETPEPHNENEVHLTDDQMAAIDLKIGKMEERAIASTISTNGYLHVPPNNKAVVSTYMAGYVKNSSLLEGDAVKKGQLMAVLENPEYVQLQQYYLELKGQLGYLKSEYERQKVLQEENINAKKLLLKAESEYKVTQAKFNGVKEKLKMLGLNLVQIDKGNISSTINIKAPIKGNVSRVDAEIGKYIQASEMMFEILDTEHIHVELNIFEKDVMKISEGQKFQMRIPSLGNDVYDGEVYLVGKALDDEKRSINAHGHLEVEKDYFLPGMYVEADLFYGTKKAMTIPEKAIINEGDENFIFQKIKKEDGAIAFRRIEVQTGLITDGWVEIAFMENLDPDAEYVFEGVYYLAAEMTKGESGGHSH
ncbi:efflux RND transporter periplasmic adaptor subunit [Fulvivirgaceae bacterium BMA10]|uniref:Efflux RND transporter periplasmic adaptor subunit n=1 Tax=Splendidivirga corallicola TaxID=3051826 RepID=A0ABT8KW38_9BACT|nr:efflux RND transporter periplasmic adaptor subunit [Fulvivirgaceae bacterium BMA10]